MKTGHVVTHAAKTVGNGISIGVKEVCHGAEVAAMDTAKGIKTDTEGIGDGIKEMVIK